MPSPPKLPDRFVDVELLSSTPIERSFKAFDRLLERDVVVRIPAASAWSGWTAPVRERLLREARALAKIQHEGVQPILWVEETAEGPLLVQPPPHGERLRARLEHEPLSVAATIALGRDIANALAAVHYASIVHRGVGPDAVWLLPDGRAQLGSFTFAKAYDARMPSSIDHARRQESSAANLLPPYPAPEQLAGRSAEPRVDVWALGCLLYRCLTGVDPESIGAERAPVDVRSVRKDVPRALAVVLRTCMQPSPTARYPTARAVADALVAATRQADRPSRRALVSLGVGAVALGALGLWRPWSDVAPMRSEFAGAPAAARAVGDGQAYLDHYTRGHALLVGIADGYQGPFEKLNGPINEVEALAERLRAIDPLWQAEGAVQVLRNASAKAVDDALEQLKESAHPDDAVFVYFAGHAVVRPKDNRYWLVGADATTDESQVERSIANGFVESRLLDNLLDHCAAKHVFVVLDCCHSGRLLSATPLRGRPVADGDAGVNRAEYLCHRARQILCSCGSNRAARDAAPGGRSRFSTAFLTGLASQSEPRRVTPRFLFAAVSGDMQGDQVPQFADSSDPDGSFVFFVRKAN